MKKLSILLCLLLVGCSNKVEQSTTSIEETTHPTTIIETTTETTVNEDIIRLESEVAELESKVSALESKLSETSVETTVEETTKETKTHKETVVVVVTATPTPTKEPTELTQTPTQTEPSETKGEHVCYCDSVTISISNLKIDTSNNFIQNMLLEELSKHVIHKNCNSILQVDSSTIPGVGYQLAPGSYQVKWYGDCGTYYQTVIISE